MNNKFKQTTKLLQKLPGVGPRQAIRFVLALLEKDETEDNLLDEELEADREVEDDQGGVDRY